MKKHIAFIGAGTMARAMIDSFDDVSLEERPHFFLINPENESLKEYVAQKEEFLREKFRKELSSNSSEDAEKLNKRIEKAAKEWCSLRKITNEQFFDSFLWESVPFSTKKHKVSPFIFLAVKPNDLEQAIRENFSFLFYSSCLQIPIISVMAGVSLERISQLIVKMALENWENLVLPRYFGFPSFKSFESCNLDLFCGSECAGSFKPEEAQIIKSWKQKIMNELKEEGHQDKSFYDFPSRFRSYFNDGTLIECTRMRVIFWENIFIKAKENNFSSLQKKDRKFFVLSIFFQPLLGRMMTNLAVENGRGVGAFCVRDSLSSKKEMFQFIQQCLDGMKVDGMEIDDVMLSRWGYANGNTDTSVLPSKVTIFPAVETLSADLYFLIEQMGVFFEVKEEQMDIVTAIAGSAPAFLAVFVETLADAGVRHGLSRTESQEMAKGVLRSTADLLENKFSQPSGAVDLKNSISSPNGTTIEGLAALDKNNFRHALMEAVAAAVQKAKVLGASNKK